MEYTENIGRFVLNWSWKYIENFTGSIPLKVQLIYFTMESILWNILRNIPVGNTQSIARSILGER